MAISRYSRVLRLAGGSMIGTSEVHTIIRNAVKNGFISCTVRILKEGERLDTLAGSLYDDAQLWWVLAAASGIGWGLQVPPGTVIKVPDLNQVIQYVS
jgi:hypothetical protein